MAQGVGFSIDASFLNKIEQADKALKKLADTNDTVVKNISNTWKQIGEQGLDSYLRSLEKQKNVLADIASIKFDDSAPYYLKKFGENARSSVAEIDKLIQTLTTLQKATPKQQAIEKARQEAYDIVARADAKTGGKDWSLTGEVALREYQAQLEAMRRYVAERKAMYAQMFDEIDAKERKQQADYSNYRQQQLNDELAQYRKNKEAQAAIDRRNYEERRKQLQETFDAETKAFNEASIAAKSLHTSMVSLFDQINKAQAAMRSDNLMKNNTDYWNHTTMLMFDHYNKQRQSEQDMANIRQRNIEEYAKTYAKLLQERDKNALNSFFANSNNPQSASEKAMMQLQSTEQNRQIKQNAEDVTRAFQERVKVWEEGFKRVEEKEKQLAINAVKSAQDFAKQMINIFDQINKANPLKQSSTQLISGNTDYQRYIQQQLDVELESYRKNKEQKEKAEKEAHDKRKKDIEEAIRVEQKADNDAYQLWLMRKHNEAKEHKRIEDEKTKVTIDAINKQNQEYQRQAQIKQQASQQSSIAKSGSANAQAEWEARMKVWEEGFRRQEQKELEAYNKWLELKHKETQKHKEAEEAKTKATIEAIDRQNKAMASLIANQQRRQRALYNATGDSTQGALNYTKRLFNGTKPMTLNNMQTALSKLQDAQKKLNLDTEEGRKKYERLGAEISRVKIRTDAFTKANENVANSHKGLLNLSDQLMRKFALVFSVSQIQGYIDKLVQVRGEFELQQRALQSILQNKDEADKIWQQTVDLAVRSPFRVGELVTYTKQLAAYRIETDKLHETTKRLADVSAGLGVDMSRLILAFGQVRAAEYLRGTELRQFTEAGIPMLEELAKHFTELEGRAISTADVFGMISKRMVAFEDVEAVFKRMTDAGGIFYNMQEIQADTLKGRISNLHDSIDLMLNDIGKANEGTLKGLVSFARDIVENWKEVADQLETAIYWLGAYKVASMAANFAVKQGATSTLWWSKNIMGLNGVLAVEAISMKKSELAALGLNRAKIFLAKTVAKLQLALNGLKMTLATMFPAILIATVYEIYRAFTAAKRAADELHESMERIDADLSKDLGKDIATYGELTAKIKDATASYSEREKAMQALKRTFGDILPDQYLEIQNIQSVADNYDKATTALKLYYETKSRELKLNATNESFATELKTDIDELTKSFSSADLKGANKTISQKFGLDETHIKSVLNRLVDDIKKGNVEVGKLEEEFVARINKMFGVDIDMSKLELTLGSMNYLNEDFSDLAKTLQRYRKEVDAITGMSYDTIVNEEHSKEVEKQRKLYEKQTDILSKLREAYSSLYRQTSINRKKGDAITEEDIAKLNGYKEDVYSLYKTLGLPLPNHSYMTQITDNAWSLEKEINQVITKVNTDFIGGLQKGIKEGNTQLGQFAETIQAKTDNLKLNDIQKFTKEVFSEVAQQYEIPIATFDKLKADSKDSLDEVSTNLKNELKRMTELRDKYDRSKKEHRDAGLSENELSDRLFKGFGITPEQRASLDNTIKAYEEAYARLGNAEDKAAKKTKKAEAKILKNRISLIEKIYKDYRELLKKMDKEDATQEIIKAYGDTFKEAFEGTNINLSSIVIDKDKLSQVKEEATTAGQVFSETMLKAMEDVMSNNTYIRDFDAEFVERLKKYEAFIETATDVEKKGKGLTIGYGEYGEYKDTGKRIQKGDTITEAEAAKRLTDVILPKFKKQINEILDANKDLVFTQEQYNVLLDLAYQGDSKAVTRLIKLSKNETEALTHIESIRTKYAKAYGKDEAETKFGEAFMTKFKEAKNVYEKMALLLQTMNLTVDGIVRKDLSGMVRRSNERAALFSGDLKVVELLQKAAINIAEIDFTNIEGVIKLLKSLKGIAGKEGQEASLALSKAISGWEAKLNLQILGIEDKNFLDSIQDMFGNYEMTLELEKLNISPDLAKQLFGVESVDLSKIRKEIEDKISKVRGSNIDGKDELVEQLEKDLKKVEELEREAQEDRLKKYVKYLQKAQDARVKIKLEELRQIDEVEKESRFTKDQKKEIKEALQKESKQAIDKQTWEDFTGSAFYIEIFKDMENASTKTLEIMRDRLMNMKDSLKNLNPEDLKAVVEQIEKIDDKLRSRQASEWEIGSNFKGMVDYLKNRSQWEAELAKYQAQSESKTKEINALAEKIAELQHITETVPFDSEEYINAAGALHDAQKRMAKLKEESKGIDNNITKFVDKLTDGKFSLDDFGNGIKAISAAFQGAVSMINNLNIGMSEGFQDTLDFAIEAATSVDQMVDGFTNIATNPKSLSGYIQVLGGVSSLVGAIFSAKDKRLERQIQNNIKMVEQLERAYQRLEKRIEDAYSVGNIQTNYELAKKNLIQQQEAYANMIEMEEAKKKTDKDKIREWKNELEDLTQQRQELEEQRLADLGGFGSQANYKSAAEEFANAWFDAYQEVGDGMGALEDTFDDFINNVVKKQLLIKGSNKLLQPVLDMIDKAVSDGEVTTQEMAEVNRKWNEDTKDALNSYYKSIYDMYDGLINGAGELSDLQRGIQNITEPQAAAIEAYLNSLRFFVSDSNRVLKEIQQQMSVGVNNPMVSELKSQTQLIRTIDENLSSVIGRGSSSHTGAYIKVLAK